MADGPYLTSASRASGESMSSLEVAGETSGARPNIHLGCAISLRVFLLPRPGGLNDFFEGGVGGFPAESALEFFLAGDENSRIAGTARTQFARDFAAGDALGGIDDFQDGEAAAVAHIEGFAGNFGNFLESANMGIGDIEDVNIVANAGSVRRGVVGPEYVDVGKATASGIENARDEMSFDAMLFAAFPGGSSSVEIAEGDVVEASVELIVSENLFKRKLGLSVGIDRRFRMVFGDGNDFGFAVSGGSGRENEFLHTVASDGIEQIHAGGHVGGVEYTRFADGFGDQRLGSKVHYGIDFVLGEDGFESRTIRQVHLAKNGTRRDRGPMALQQAIQGDDGHTAGNQHFGANTADITSRSSNKNIHSWMLLNSGRNEKCMCSSRREATARAQMQGTAV